MILAKSRLYESYLFKINFDEDKNKRELFLEMTKGSERLPQIVYYDCCEKYKDLAYYFIECAGNPSGKYSTGDINFSLYHVCIGGFLDIAKILIKEGADEYDMALQGAISKNHMNIILHMLEAGAKYIGDAIATAIIEGYPYLVDYFLSFENRDRDPFNYYSKSYKTLALFHFSEEMLKKNYDNYDYLFLSMSSKYHSFVKYLVKIKNIDEKSYEEAAEDTRYDRKFCR